MYDEAGHLLGEYTSTGALIEETVWLRDFPVATIRPDGSGVAVFYVHADHLNSPIMVTRPSDGAIIWRWDKDPFGTAVPNQNPSSLGVFEYNLRFPGQYYDQETGLNYNYFRDYDANKGKYVESDPIGLGGGINAYTYVGNSPVGYFDAYGLYVNQNGYPLSNPFVKLNLDILNSIIVGSGIADNCFEIRVTGGDRFRDPVIPSEILSAKDGSPVADSAANSPHLIDQGARAVDFTVINKKACGCKPVTNSIVDAALLGTDFTRTFRDYPSAPHTHVDLPNLPSLQPGAFQ